MEVVVDKVIDTRLAPVNLRLDGMRRRTIDLESRSDAGSVSARSSRFLPGYIQINICRRGERRTKGMSFTAAKAWWTALREEFDLATGDAEAAWHRV